MPTEKFTKIKAEEQQKIIDAAVDEFLDVGHHNLTLAGVAKRLGISPEQIGEYFPDEDDLLSYSARWVADFWENKFANEYNAFPAEDKSTEMVLAESFRTTLEWSQKYAAYARFGMKLNYEVELSDPLRLQYHNHGLDLLIQFVTQIIERGKQRGEVRQDIHHQVAAFWIQFIMFHVTDASVLLPLDEGLGMQSEEYCEVANATLDLLLRGIEPPIMSLSAK